MIKKKKKGSLSPGMPVWVGNTPFPPHKKKPAHIKEGDEIITVYGSGDERISTRVFVSTDKILISDWVVPPGQSFQPPDIHSGQEPYYILKGEATILNPETGQTIVAGEGDVVLIPAKCWHQVYNFTEDEMIIVAIIEGKMWDAGDIDLVSDYTLKPKFFKG